MTDRDHFAAAALAGLLAQGDDGSFSEESYARSAYRWADAMLSVRDSRTADKPNLDAAPAARADADRSRTDKAVIRPGEGTGDTLAKRDTTPPRNGTPADGSVQGGCTLTETEREALHWFAHYGLPEHHAATLRGLLERLGAANSGDDRRSVGGE
jgi:hypothetical protein